MQAAGHRVLDGGAVVREERTHLEGGRDHIGKEVKINVTSVLQTSAGRMIFGKYLSA